MLIYIGVGSLNASQDPAAHYSLAAARVGISTASTAIGDLRKLSVILKGPSKQSHWPEWSVATFEQEHPVDPMVTHESRLKTPQNVCSPHNGPAGLIPRRVHKLYSHIRHCQQAVVMCVLNTAMVFYSLRNVYAVCILHMPWAKCNV